MSTSEIVFGLGFAVLLAVIAFITARLPLRNLKRLSADGFIPSDERRYLRNQARRRLLNSFFMLVLGGFLGWTYLSGMERQAGDLVKKVDEAKQAQREIPNDEKEKDKEFFKAYFTNWIGILVMLLVIVTIAIMDLWATQRYANQQLKILRNDHKAKLDRDLAMYRQQMNDRRRGLKK